MSDILETESNAVITAKKTEIVSSTMQQIEKRCHCVNKFELHPPNNSHV